ncbi:hypothetical protein SISNIDRAFT_510069 [Sistotremastrum niveocremeum HHB9708]|uniref:F-box domain-containing protein n=1 Tax=Sistotremastrum niveocremeum HHB9708 TaxID=1314777 RepID=A0A164U2C6_9AGAM|nr:hypothetical protein SISNIDRAFT_510069 [Sistotremastrum niveocremeum HHB9708]
MKDFMLLLPDEMIVNCLLELSLEDLRNVGARALVQTCRRFQDILTSQRKPWYAASDVHRLPLPMGKTFHTIPIQEIYGLACRAVTLQKKFAKDVVAPSPDDLQPSRALVTRYLCDAQGVLIRQRPAGILPGGRIVVVYWLHLIRFYTIDGNAFMHEIRYDGALQAIEWTSEDNGARTTVAIVVESRTSIFRRKNTLVYDLLYTITDRNKEKLSIKKLAEVDLPENFRECYTLTLRDCYIVLFDGAGIRVIDWNAGKRFQFFLINVDDDDDDDDFREISVLQRVDIHPSRPDLILQFSTYSQGIWIETLPNIDELLLSETNSQETWKQISEPPIHFVKEFPECLDTKATPISRIERDTSGTFDMVFLLERAPEDPPSICSISLSLADSSLSFKDHGYCSVIRDFTTFKTSRGDKVLALREDYQSPDVSDYYPDKGDRHDDLRLIFPPYESAEYPGSPIRETKLGLPEWLQKCKRCVIVGVDHIYGFALIWTDFGLSMMASTVWVFTCIDTMVTTI